MNHTARTKLLSAIKQANTAALKRELRDRRIDRHSVVSKTTKNLCYAELTRRRRQR